MTVPHLMNCPHSDEGWCLECVVELGNENWRLRDVARDAADAATQHQAEVLRLRAALQKIADWDSNWGPFPENNEAWRAMVVVTAREAVPLGPDVGVEPPCLVGSNDGSNPLQLETGESMNDRPAVRDETAFPLVPCPLCGGTSCYVLGDGSTHRWWIMLCADCGADVAECRSDGSTRIDAPKPARWPAADEAWNEAGAHAAGLRAELAQVADYLETLTTRCINDSAELAQARAHALHGWLEAAIAWEVCASIHSTYAKGKDALFTTRHADFVKHANDSRAMAASPAPTAPEVAQPVMPACWACGGTQTVTTSSNGSGLIEAECLACAEDDGRCPTCGKAGGTSCGAPNCGLLT